LAAQSGLEPQAAQRFVAAPEVLALQRQLTDGQLRSTADLHLTARPHSTPAVPAVPAVRVSPWVARMTAVHMSPWVAGMAAPADPMGAADPMVVAADRISRWVRHMVGVEDPMAAAARMAVAAVIMAEIAAAVVSLGRDGDQ
jgi:hypothetical protein